MDIESAIEDAITAMDNIADMDTTQRQYATACIKVFAWRSIEKSPPENGEFVLVSDYKTRWIDRYFYKEGCAGINGKKPVVWHPILDLPQQEPKP